MAVKNTEGFVDLLDTIAKSKIPDKVVGKAKRCLLDYIGVRLAGNRLVGKKCWSLLDHLRCVSGPVTVIGCGRTSNVLIAALVNGISAHAAELDDGDRSGSVHPGATVVSALLPVAEAEGLKETDVLKGIVVGYEATVRVARAMQPSHRERGFHATGTCGTIGSSMGVGAALGFSRKQMQNALGAAATSASGLLQTIKGNSELKPFNAGRAALCGVLAAYMARAGFKGPGGVLDGDRWGLLSVMSQVEDTVKVNASWSEVFAVEKVYMKPYAACRHCHPVIDAVLDIRNSEGVEYRDVKAIRVATYALAVDGHSHCRPEGPTAAKMSIPFSAAVAMVTGSAGIREFIPERLDDREVLSLASKVEVESDPYLTSLVPNKRPAVVEIITNSGLSYRRRVDLPKGEPENPLSDEEIEAKFRSLALFAGLSEEQSSAIIKSVLYTEADITNLMGLLK